MTLRLCTGRAGRQASRVIKQMCLDRAVVASASVLTLVAAQAMEDGRMGLDGRRRSVYDWVKVNGTAWSVLL